MSFGERRILFPPLWAVWQGCELRFYDIDRATIRHSAQPCKNEAGAAAGDEKQPLLSLQSFGCAALRRSDTITQVQEAALFCLVRCKKRLEVGFRS